MKKWNLKGDTWFAQDHLSWEMAKRKLDSRSLPEIHSAVQEVASAYPQCPREPCSPIGIPTVILWLPVQTGE